ncbi:MAG: nidogen-like domain-containing protein [Crocinitomicaceae bacterium]
MMKNIYFALSFLICSSLYSQVITDSPLYQKLKASGQLGNVNIQPSTTIGATKGKPTVKPNSNAKANACDCYIEPDSTYILAMQPNDDGSTGLIPIPFNFNLYGQTFNSIYINNNGNITFNGPLSTFSATAFPSTGNAIVAPFWADVDTRNGNGQVVYKITPTAVYINWEDVGYYSMQGDKLNTFQLIITNGSDPVIDQGNVAFCYQDMQWTTGSASQGINGFYGIPATCGANKGDGVAYFLISRFDHPGVDFDGALGNPDGISWLDYKSFAFDASNSGNVPPIPEGIASCDTFKICAAGDTAQFAINFLSPEVNQTTSITYTNGGLSTLSQVANISGNTGSIILEAIGTLATIGTYSVTVTATDDAVPTPGVTSLTFVIVIDTIVNNLDSAALLGTGACGNVDLSVSNGPYDTYLWDDFTTTQTSAVSSTQIYGVTVSKNGCYKHISDTIIVMNPVPVNLQGILTYCPPDTSTTISVPNEPYYSSITWGLTNPAVDSLFTVELPLGTYTVTLVDSAGFCTMDTTFTIFGSAASSILGDTLLCSPSLQVANTQSSGGTWTASSNQVTFDNPSNLNPLITVNAPGTYTITFTDNTCNQSHSSEITLPVNPSIFPNVNQCNLTYNVSGTVVDATGGTWTYTTPSGGTLNFTPSNTSANPSITATASGTYQLTYTDNVCNHTATTTIQLYTLPSIDVDTLACNYNYYITGTSSSLGGNWSAVDTCLHFSDPSADNPQITTNYAGNYTISYTDIACNQTLTAQIEFPPYLYTQVLDTNICNGTTFSLNPLQVNSAKDSTMNNVWTLQANYVPTQLGLWNLPNATTPLIVGQPGNYIYTLSNECYTVSDTATIGLKPCDIIAPNIISLSSTVGNNVFFVQYSGLESFRCTILNRWGNVIYEYDNPAGGWDGKTSGGDLVSEGTYFYRIDAKFEGAEPIVKHGFVEVKY